MCLECSCKYGYMNMLRVSCACACRVGWRVYVYIPDEARKKNMSNQSTTNESSSKVCDCETVSWDCQCQQETMYQTSNQSMIISGTTDMQSQDGLRNETICSRHMIK
jgi:hypothetical protein